MLISYFYNIIRAISDNNLSNSPSANIIPPHNGLKMVPTTIADRIS